MVTLFQREPDTSATKVTARKEVDKVPMICDSRRRRAKPMFVKTPGTNETRRNVVVFELLLQERR